MAELSLTNNTLLTPSIAIFSPWLTALTSTIKALTHITNITQILSVIIVPYNLCHKVISQLTHEMTENNNNFEPEKND